MPSHHISTTYWSFDDDFQASLLYNNCTFSTMLNDEDDDPSRLQKTKKDQIVYFVFIEAQHGCLRGEKGDLKCFKKNKGEHWFRNGASNIVFFMSEKSLCSFLIWSDWSQVSSSAFCFNKQIRPKQMFQRNNAVSTIVYNAETPTSVISTCLKCCTAKA